MAEHAVATREEATPDLICDHAYRAVCRCGWEDDQVRGWGSARKKAQEHVDLHALAAWGDELRAAERAVWVARIEALERAIRSHAESVTSPGCGYEQNHANKRLWERVGLDRFGLASVVSEEPAPTEEEQT